MSKRKDCTDERVGDSVRSVKTEPRRRRSERVIVCDACGGEGVTDDLVCCRACGGTGMLRGGTYNE